MTSRQPLLALILLLLAGSLHASTARAAPGHAAESVRALWLDVRMGPPLVDWFNRVAQPDDIARVDNPGQADLLDQVTAGRKLVVFKSVAEAERLVPSLADTIDVIGYNIEHESATPSEEQAEPVQSVRRMQDLARTHGLLLAVGPDHDFALSHGAEMAPYVDVFVLQIQRVQTDPRRVRNFVLPMAQQLRQANPDLEISVQVRTEGDVVAIVDLIDSMKEHLDGVSILTSPETVAVAEALVAEIRARAPGTLTPPTATTLAADDEPLAAPTESGSETVQTPVRLTPVATSTPADGAPARSNVPWVPLLGGALLAGLIGGGVMAVLLWRFYPRDQ